jgi:hypothetical protein
MKVYRAGKSHHPPLCQKEVMPHCESETNTHASITCQCWHIQYTQTGSNISHISYECVGACIAVTVHLSSVTQTKQCPLRTHNPAQLFSVLWFHLQEPRTRYTSLQQQNSHMTHYTNLINIQGGLNVKTELMLTLYFPQMASMTYSSSLPSASSGSNLHSAPSWYWLQPGLLYNSLLQTAASAVVPTPSKYFHYTAN